MKAKGCRLAGALAYEPALAREGIEEEDTGYMDAIEVEEGFSLDDLLEVLGELEAKALGERIHGR